MIFNTTQDELGKTHLSVAKPSGILDVFKRQSILSDDDIACVKAYNAEIERGVSPVTAYYKTMQNASETAVNLAQKTAKTAEETQRTTGVFGDARISLNGLTKSSRAAEFGMKALSTAGNMLLSMGISFAISAIISGISKAANAYNEIAEQAQEATKTFKEQSSSLESNKAKISELRKELTDETLSYTDATNKRGELLDIQQKLIETYLF